MNCSVYDHFHHFCESHCYLYLLWSLHVRLYIREMEQPFTVRRSTQADQLGIAELEIPEASVRSKLFGKVSTGALIETCSLALTATDVHNPDRLLGFVVFNDTPLGKQHECTSPFARYLNHYRQLPPVRGILVEQVTDL